MKKGFTLAELLIVLGITGIVAAVLLPAINNLMPDKTKIMYLKVYNELTSDIKSLISNTSLYPIALTNGTEDIDVTKIPLLNNTQPLKTPFKDDSKYSGTAKLCNLIAYTMNANDNAKCSQTSYPDTPSYTTQNGMRWWIVESKNEINSSEKKASYQTDIYVDIDPSKKSGNCMFGDSNCKQPDIFKFLLAADGTLIPADPLGRKYIETQKSWLKKKYDIDGDVLAKLDDNLLENEYKNIVEPLGANSGMKEDQTSSDNDDNQTPYFADEPYFMCGSNVREMDYPNTDKKINCIQTGWLNGSVHAPANEEDYIVSIADYPVASDIIMDYIFYTEDGKQRLSGCKIPKGETTCKHIHGTWQGEITDDVRFFNHGGVWGESIFKDNTYVYIAPGDIIVNSLPSTPYNQLESVAEYNSGGCYYNYVYAKK